jgi:hypothetical protein
MEYVKTAFSKVNDRNAKKIVLHLCKNKGREMTRKELLDDLNLDMSDEELEEKLEAMVRTDIINQGQTNFDYRCVGDNRKFAGNHPDHSNQLLAQRTKFALIIDN